MATTVPASTTYVFGIDAGYITLFDTHVKLESITLESSPEFEATAKDGGGEIKSHVVGALKRNFTASGFMVATTDTIPGAFAIGASFAIDGETYIVNRATITKTNTDFKKIELSGLVFANITL